jgi:hypothetical protein
VPPSRRSLTGSRRCTTATSPGDADFLLSRWTCLWGRGCHGILPEPSAHLEQGCCSIGADLDEDDALALAATVPALTPVHFQHHGEAVSDGVFRDHTRSSTRLVNGACIFLNRPGFEGGVGCALHLAAVAVGESPMHWKPSVCWQLPIKVDWVETGDGAETATVRRWHRADWGAEGVTMHWCCTEGSEAYVGERRVVELLAEELTELVGESVYVELRRRWG